uniref:Uncharacterized protein n=1 Tax=Strigamia maritima TaxID=126957 RepID=T1JDG6_STRMM
MNGHESFDIPFQSFDIPFQSFEIPFQTFDIPFQSFDIPFQTFDIPFQTFDIQFQTFDIPFQVSYEKSQGRTNRQEFASGVRRQASGVQEGLVVVPHSRVQELGDVKSKKSGAKGKVVSILGSCWNTIGGQKVEDMLDREDDIEPYIQALYLDKSGN